MPTHQKEPKKVAAGHRGAEARKAKEEALFKHLLSVKAELKEATPADPVTASAPTFSRAGGTVDAPPHGATDRSGVSPWLYLGAGAVLVAITIYVWQQPPRGRPDSDTLCPTPCVMRQLNRERDIFHL